jgi:hypothetical protein
MELISRNIPLNCEIVIGGDTHIGSTLCYEKGIAKLVKYVKENKDVYMIHMGDWIEAIATDDKRYQSDTTKTPIPMLQADQAIELYSGISKRFLVGLCGNHEFKLHRYGDLAKYICEGVGTPYGGYVCKLSLYNKGNLLFKGFLGHGGSGALTSNAKDYEQGLANLKANLKKKLVNKASDCLIMGYGHYHQCLVVNPAERLIIGDDGKQITQNYLGAGLGTDKYIEPERRWYFCSGTALKTFELGTASYSERAGYDPIELMYISIKIRNGKPVSVERKFY